MARHLGIWAERRRRAATWLGLARALWRRHIPEVGHLPGPRSLGSLALGQDLCRGNLRFGGRLIIAPDSSIWAIVAPDDAFRMDRHGFGWLDHLAAVPTPEAEALARDWTRRWVQRHGRGRALGWLPELTARRLIRCLHHYEMLVGGFDPETKRAFDRALWRQAHALRHGLNRVPDGLEVLEAVAALALCGRALAGFPGLGRLAVERLDMALHAVALDGAIASRNPEELMQWLTHLVWLRDDLVAAERPVPPAVSEAIARITPLLRSLRHAGGGLARFHGGGPGIAGQLDQALADARVRGLSPEGGMGFTRMTSGRSSLIVDTAPPPHGARAYHGQASTLGFELVSGRRPLIVSCGSGAPFGPDWQQAGRATPSHSVLGLEGVSSSRLGKAEVVLGQSRQILVGYPNRVTAHLERHLDYLRLEASHDGYAEGHGLLMGRALELTVDGSGLSGEEVLLADTPQQRAQFDRIAKGGGIGFVLRFHLHPDVAVQLDVDQAVVYLTLPSNEVWAFRHDGGAKLTVEPSVYLDPEAVRPTATKQVVLTGRAMAYATRVRWSLAKTTESLTGLRDLAELDADPIDSTLGVPA